MQSALPYSTTITWTLQFALSLGVALGAAALALTFRRPAMRLLVAASLLSAISAGLILLGVGAPALGVPDARAPILALAVFPLSPWVLSLVYLHLVRVVASRTERPWPTARVTGWVAAGALLAGAGILRLSPPGSSALIATVASACTVLTYLALAAVAFWWGGKAGPTRHPVRLLAIAFALLSLRSAINVVVSGAAAIRGDTPVYGAGFAVLLLGFSVVATVLTFVAVLEDERVAIESNAERLRTAEASRAASVRLEGLGRMASAVAHDFNNLLAVISLTAASAREADAAQVREDLADIDSAARRGQDLTRQLLAFARQAPQQVTRFDAAAHLHKLHDLLRRMVDRGVALGIEVPSEPLLVEMDATQFDQVVMNLVVNGRDAMNGRGTITVRLDAVDERGAGGARSPGRRWVRLSVTDTGPGIPPDVLPHIFEPFFTTRKAGEGTGLGLATCDGIIRQVGGRIDVRTAVGAGTTMAVLIPQAPVA